MIRFDRAFKYYKWSLKYTTAIDYLVDNYYLPPLDKRKIERSSVKNRLLLQQQHNDDRDNMINVETNKQEKQNLFCYFSIFKIHLIHFDNNIENRNIAHENLILAFQMCKPDYYFDLLNQVLKG